MDDFLLIVGNGWVEILNPTEWIDQAMGEADMLNLINSQSWTEISNYMESAGYIPENSLIQSARMLNTGEQVNRLRFWYIPEEA